MQPILGRPLAGSAPNITVNLIEPHSILGARVNELNMRVGKIFRFGRSRANVGVDFYNLLNAATPLSYNQAFIPERRVADAYVGAVGAIRQAESAARLLTRRHPLQRWAPDEPGAGSTTAMWSSRLGLIPSKNPHLASGSDFALRSFAGLEPMLESSSKDEVRDVESNRRCAHLHAASFSRAPRSRRCQRRTRRKAPRLAPANRCRSSV